MEILTDVTHFTPLSSGRSTDGQHADPNQTESTQLLLGDTGGGLDTVDSSSHGSEDNGCRLARDYLLRAEETVVADSRAQDKGKGKSVVHKADAVPDTDHVNAIAGTLNARINTHIRYNSDDSDCDDIPVAHLWGGRRAQAGDSESSDGGEGNDTLALQSEDLDTCESRSGGCESDVTGTGSGGNGRQLRSRFVACT